MVECRPETHVQALPRKGACVAGSDKGIAAPTLIVTGGALDGQSVILARGSDTLLGSGPGSALPLQLGNVAGEHARLAWAGQDVLLSDLASPTGTYVNGERIDAEHPLADGDRVCLGPPGSKQSVKLLVRLPDLASEPLQFDVEASEGTLDLSGPDAPPEDTAAAPIFDFGGSLEGPAVDPHAPLVLLDPSKEQAVRRGTAEGITPSASDELEGSFAPQPPAVPAPPVAPPPAPKPTASAPAPAMAAKPPASITESRKAVRPEYTNDMPSIAPDRPREAPSVPAMPAVKLPGPLKRPAPRSTTIRMGNFDVPPWALGLVAGVVLLAVLGMFLLRSAPAIEAVFPESMYPGGTITITGRGFSSSPEANEVRFGDQPGQVSSASDERLTVSVPKVDLSQGPKDVTLTVRANGKTSAARKLRLFLVSRIQSINPDIALPGAEVVINLADLPDGAPKVTMQGRPVELLSSQGRTLKVRVPELGVPLGTRVPVTLDVVGDPGPPAFLVIGKLPLLSEAVPASGQAGTRVTLLGRGFSSEPARNQVRFGGHSVPVLSASPTELLVSAPPPPASESQFPAAITVSVDGSASNSVSFAQRRPSSAVFVPRFFAAQVQGQPQQLFVSSELGPLILLGDKDDAPSLGERAARVVEALNAALDATQSGKAPTFELRESPRPGVGLAGGALLLAAAPADVAAYQSQAKGQQASPRGLAAYWNALLQDYFALFTAYRRPSAVAELSPRGRVLIDLFADAQRHAAAGSSGVPRSLVLPLTPNLERDLREMALLLPSSAAKAAVAGMAIEGAWSGSMDETGVGTREIQVSLQRQDGKLGGALTTRSRSLAMGIPLTDVSYDKGTLRFTALIGGAPRQFVGTLQGATLSGSLRTPGGKTTLGSFTLTFVT